VNKAQLIDRLSVQLGSKKAATDAVEAVVDTITRAVASGEKVAITGFGAFERVSRPARTGRNPRTGAAVKIKKTTVPKFRPGQGFKDVVMMGDSGGNLNGMKDVAAALNAEWKGQGAVHFIPEYYNYGDVEQFQEKVLGIHEKLEGYHDDYYISAIISTVSTDAIRMPERVKAGNFVINGVPLAPIEKTIENGKKMIAFRTEAAVTAIKKSMGK